MIVRGSGYDARNFSFATAFPRSLRAHPPGCYLEASRRHLEPLPIVQANDTDFHRRRAALKLAQPHPMTTDTIPNLALSFNSLTTLFLGRCTAFSPGIPQKFPPHNRDPTHSIQYQKARSIESLKLCATQYIPEQREQSGAWQVPVRSLSFQFW